LPVSIDAAAAQPVTVDCSGSSWASSVPSYSARSPRTVEIIMCLTSNATLECDWSTFQVPAGTLMMPCSVISCVIDLLLAGGGCSRVADAR
jgi:hypothetical protein